MTADEQTDSIDRPHKFAGRTPDAQRRQRENLTPAAAVRHGAYSADKLQPERERVLGELLASFPGVRRDRLELAAAQRARIVLLQAYVDAVGVIRHRKRGETYPAVTLLQREEAAYRAELARIEDLACAVSGGSSMGDELASARAALEARSSSGGAA
jgi:hypothetical protein